MKISVCIITKNEENNINECLKSIYSKFDEIIVVDTGSNDKTKKIASEYTDKIFDFIWCNDFSKARNYSLSKATNDWIIVIDADEIIVDIQMETLQRIIKDEEKVGRIKRINSFEDDNETKKYIERVNRLFNKKYYEYEGIIHEQLINKNKSTYETINIPITFDHIGYTKDVVNRTNKIQRNIRLLKEALKNNKSDSYINYQLGKSYFMDKDYENAYKYFYDAINKETNYSLEFVVDLIVSFGYTFLNLKEYERAIELEKYNNYYDNISDYNFVMALIYMNNGLFSKAVENFLKCTQSSDECMEGINSYRSYYNIGVIYECLGYINEAIGYYNLCGNYEKAQVRLKNI